MFKKMLGITLVILGLCVLPVSTYASEEKQNYYFLYNSNTITNEDLGAINKYIDNFDKAKINSVLKDVGTADEYQIYGYLKKQSKVDAVQIFGMDKDVPSFKVQKDVVMGSGVQEVRTEKVDFKYAYETDYFYNNLGNEIEQIKDFTIKNYTYKVVRVDLTPQIKVIRLPVTKGDYTAYLNKYDIYTKTHPGVLPLTSFYLSAFGDHPMSIDHLNYFIQGNLDYEGNIIDSSIYSLFGQKEFYDMNLNTSGTYTKENMAMMNQKQMQNFVFSGHGDKNGFWHSGESELNNKNVDTILGENYYNMTAISCNNAEGMDKENFVYKMLKGKGVYIMALTDFYYFADLSFQKDMDYTVENDDFRYFYFEYYKNLYNGINLTESFYNAQKIYVSRIQKKNIGQVSQPQLSNLIFCQNFGVLEYTNTEKKYTYMDTLNDQYKNEFTSYIQRMTKEIGEFELIEKQEKEELEKRLNKEYEFKFSRNGIEDIHTELKGVKINKINYTKNEKEIVIHIDFDSIQKGGVLLRSKNPDGGEGPNIFQDNFKAGNNKLEIPIQLKFLFTFDPAIDLFCHGGATPSDMDKPGGGNHYITITKDEVE